MFIHIPAQPASELEGYSRRAERVPSVSERVPRVSERVPRYKRKKYRKGAHIREVYERTPLRLGQMNAALGLFFFLWNVVQAPA